MNNSQEYVILDLKNKECSIVPLDLIFKTCHRSLDNIWSYRHNNYVYGGLKIFTGSLEECLYRTDTRLSDFNLIHCISDKNQTTQLQTTSLKTRFEMSLSLKRFTENEYIGIFY